MMYVYVLLLFSIINIQAVEPVSEQSIIQERTHKIYHRYYLIKRLEPSVRLLQEDFVLRLIDFERLDPTLFCTEKIQLAVQRMSFECSVAPFLDLWHTFCSYCHIYNVAFRNEFIELIYHMCDLIGPIGESHRLGQDIEGTLSGIDFVTDKLTYGIVNRSYMSIQNEIKEVDTDLIAQRFLVIKRLNKSMHFLSYLHDQNEASFNVNKKKHYFSEGLADMIEEIELFDHDRIRESIAHMSHEKNLGPLLRLCSEFKQYRFAQDDRFLQEMLMNIFLVYKSLLFKNLSLYAEQVIMTEMNQVLEIYERLDSLPLDETLEAIDVATDKLISIQALEKNEKGRYLWAAIPGVLLSVGLAAYYYILK